MNKIKYRLLKFWYGTTDKIPMVRKKRERKVLAMIGASLMTEIPKNRTLRNTIKKKAPNLNARLRAIGVKLEY